MIDLYPSAVDAWAETFIKSDITSSIPSIGNATICAYSICTTGHASINFYYSPILQVQLRKFSLVQAVYVG